MINDKSSNIGLRTVLNPPSGNSRSANQSEDKPSATTAEPSVEQGSVVSSVDKTRRASSQQPIEPEKKAEVNRLEAEKNTQEVKEKVQDTITKARELMQKNQRSLDFKVAEKENRVIITVIDEETQKVIRQIPPEDLYNIVESFDDSSQGFQSGAILYSKV